MKPVLHTHLPLTHFPLFKQFKGQTFFPIVLQKVSGSGQLRLPFKPETLIFPAALQVTVVLPTITCKVVERPDPTQLYLKQNEEAVGLLVVVKSPLKHLLPADLP